jgi:hypothetical protein
MFVVNYLLMRGRHLNWRTKVQGAQPRVSRGDENRSEFV